MPLARCFSPMSCVFLAALLGASYAATKAGDVPDNKEAELAPTVHHKVRLVRENDRVTLFLDSKEILSADVSDAKEFGNLKLHLVGTWGKDGSIVYFDNLLVRMPPDKNK
jgi:hypothetical protein